MVIEVNMSYPVYKNRRHVLRVISKIRRMLWGILKKRFNILPINLTMELMDSITVILGEISRAYFECSEIIEIEGEHQPTNLVSITPLRFMTDCQYDYIGVTPEDMIILLDYPISYDLFEDSVIISYLIGKPITVAKDTFYL